MCKYTPVTYVHRGCKRSPKHTHTERQITEPCDDPNRGLYCPNLQQDTSVTFGSVSSPGVCPLCPQTCKTFRPLSLRPSSLTPLEINPLMEWKSRVASAPCCSLLMCMMHRMRTSGLGCGRWRLHFSPRPLRERLCVSPADQGGMQRMWEE